MKKLIFVLLPIAILGCCGKKNVNTTLDAQNQVVALSRLVSEPEMFLNKEIEISGLLVSEGNYFGDMKMLLKDDGGHSLPVQPWLIMEVPPAEQDSKVARPEVMSDYLLQHVVLHGALILQNGSYIFKVIKSAIVK